MRVPINTSPSRRTRLSTGEHCKFISSLSTSRVYVKPYFTMDLFFGTSPETFKTTLDFLLFWTTYKSFSAFQSLLEECCQSYKRMYAHTQLLFFLRDVFKQRLHNPRGFKYIMLTLENNIHYHCWRAVLKRLQYDILYTHTHTHRI